MTKGQSTLCYFEIVIQSIIADLGIELSKYNRYPVPLVYFRERNCKYDKTKETK